MFTICKLTLLELDPVSIGLLVAWSIWKCQVSNLVFKLYWHPAARIEQRTSIRLIMWTMCKYQEQHMQQWMLSTSVETKNRFGELQCVMTRWYGAPHCDVCDAMLKLHHHSAHREPTITQIMGVISANYPFSSQRWVNIWSKPWHAIIENMLVVTFQSPITQPLTRQTFTLLSCWLDLGIYMDERFLAHWMS